VAQVVEHLPNKPQLNTKDGNSGGIEEQNRYGCRKQIENWQK
jgi:hypothetical protein